MAIEIVDLPIENGDYGGSFHSFLYVYQTGYPMGPFTSYWFHSIQNGARANQIVWRSGRQGLEAWNRRSPSPQLFWTWKKSMTHNQWVRQSHQLTDLGMSENGVQTPNEIAIFRRDNDQQNHWVQWGTQHFQTNPSHQLSAGQLSQDPDVRRDPGIDWRIVRRCRTSAAGRYKWSNCPKSKKNEKWWIIMG